MGKCIKIIKTGIDVSKVSKQLRSNPADWGHQEKSEGVRSLINEHGFDDLPTKEQAKHLQKSWNRYIKNG